MKKKILIIMSLIITLLLFSTISILASQNGYKASGFEIGSYNVDPTTNFFTKKEDKRLIEIEDKRSELVSNGYKLIAENNNLILYRLDKTIGIAIYDKVNGYTWYSTYPKYQSLTLTNNLKAKIESGITIEYYDGNGSTINTAELSFTTPKSNATVTYEKMENGFVAKVKFPTVGISFSCEVYLDGADLIVNVPYESIVEEEVGKLTIKTYQLKSISLFPYFGGQNYEINGYSFIPDGSGALIRYTDEVSSTAYMKKVYGVDLGISQESTTNEHIKNVNNITLPIYGVNHGYNQAAFLCEIESGFGACELHSYPYMYNNLGINTTFFKINTRDTYVVNLSSTSKITLINDEVFASNYKLRYSFLENDNASYVGMAKKYRETLDLTMMEVSNENIPLHLNVLGLDYKPGLFGNNYVTMTKYSEALNIVNDLEEADVKNFSLSYLGWTSGGYFNRGSTSAKIASKLGSKKDILELNNYMNEHNYSIDYTINPMISSDYSMNRYTVKKLNLSTFEVNLKSSMEQTGSYIVPTQLSKTINSKLKRYNKYNISGLNIDNLSSTYSYRYNSNVVYRGEMIEKITNELNNINELKISTTTPNNYLLKYLTNYYEANYESSKYLYVTDSIPFVSILLSGYINLFSENFNYISNYELVNLRLVEYNIYPSFIITENEAYKLRYTNYEYLNSTQYALWKGQISEVYSNINDALKYVRASKIINHKYLDEGICEVTYDNNYKIYINYTTNSYTVDGVIINPQNYLVVRGD